jgi:mannose-1-phosphate guanylyltransferase
MAVCVVGCEELIVVATKDAVLVIPKDRAQDVRHAVQELKRRNLPQV